MLSYGKFGAGLGFFGNSFTDVKTLAKDEKAPGTFSAHVWITGNTAPTGYESFVDAGVSGKSITIVVNDSNSRFRRGVGNLRLSNGQDWDTPKIGDSISFVYVAELEQWIETSRSVN